MEISIWKRNRPIFLVLLMIAVLAVILPYKDVLLSRSAFAPYSYQSTLVLDAGHGGCELRQ